MTACPAPPLLVSAIFFQTSALVARSKPRESKPSQPIWSVCNSWWGQGKTLDKGRKRGKDRNRSDIGGEIENPAKKTKMQTDNLNVGEEERKVHVVAVNTRATNRGWDLVKQCDGV